MALFNRQDAQLGSTRDTLVGYIDNTPPAATMESGAAHIADDLNNVRSMLAHFKSLQTADWYAAIETPTQFPGEGAAQRGIDLLGSNLYDVERKRILRDVHNFTDIVVGAGNNFVILDGGAGELPSNTTAAVGAVTTLGTVVADNSGGFGAHSLAEVAGSNAINPKNLVAVFDGSTREPLTSGGRQIWGLLQSENAADGFTITTLTPNRVQISFVRVNATGDDLEAVPFADIENATINYCFRERVGFEDVTEQDFLKGAIVGLPGGTTVTRQQSYNGQGVTPVDLGTNATLDLEAAGIFWQIRDDLEAVLFRITEGSAGGTTELDIGADVDVLDIDAIDVDVAQGMSVATSKTRPIDIGETDGVIESTAGDLEVQAAAELFLDDGNRGASTFSVPLKITEDPAEWSALDSQFGEVSLAAMMLQAAQGEETRVDATFTSNVSSGNDINGPGTPHANVDADLLAYDVAGISRLRVYFNGELAWLTRDYVAGGTPADGDLQLTFNARGVGGNPDFLSVIRLGENV